MTTNQEAAIEVLDQSEAGRASSSRMLISGHWPGTIGAAGWPGDWTEGSQEHVTSPWSGADIWSLASGHHRDIGHQPWLTLRQGRTPTASLLLTSTRCVMNR